MDFITFFAWIGMSFTVLILLLLFQLLIEKLKKKHIKVRQIFCKHRWDVDDILQSNLCGDHIKAKCRYCKKTKEYWIDGIYNYFELKY